MITTPHLYMPQVTRMEELFTFSRSFEPFTPKHLNMKLTHKELFVMGGVTSGLIKKREGFPPTDRFIYVEPTPLVFDFIRENMIYGTHGWLHDSYSVDLMPREDGTTSVRVVYQCLTGGRLLARLPTEDVIAFLNPEHDLKWPH